MPRDDELRAKTEGHWTLDDERWNGHRREHAVANEARHDRDIALEKSLDQYKQSANEFRGSLDDQRRLFVTKGEHDLWGQRLTFLENDKIARDAADKQDAVNRTERESRERVDRLRSQFILGVLVTFASVVFSAVVTAILHGIGVL